MLLGQQPGPRRAEAERRGLYKPTSRMFADNHSPRAAHRTAGFEEVGIQRRHGTPDGQWKDCVLVEHLLGPGSESAVAARCSGLAMELVA